MPEVFSMTSEPESLAPMRAWLRATLVRHGVRPDDVAPLVLAASELCANAIEHAYGGAAGQPITLSVRADAGRLVVEIEDFGAPFDPRQWDAVATDPPSERGYGLAIARALTDELSFDVGRERGTRWTLVKRIPPDTVSHPS